MSGQPTGDRPPSEPGAGESDPLVGDSRPTAADANDPLFGESGQAPPVPNPNPAAGEQPQPGEPMAPQPAASTAMPPTGSPVPGPDRAPGAPGQPGALPTTQSGRAIPPIVKRIGAVVLAIVVVFLVRGVMNRTSADVLEVGQCVSRDGDEIKGIDCGDQNAKYKVLLIQKDTTEASIDTVCSKAPDTTTTYFEGRKGETKGNIICLEALK